MRSLASHHRVAVLVAVCLLWGVVPTTGVAPPAGANPCVGTIDRSASGMTVISVQGFNESGKQPPMLVGFGPRGDLLWVHHNADEFGAVWGYDVDPMANGNLFVTATVGGGTTLVYEFDPRTQEAVWTETFNIADTHDADLINNGSDILVANMRNADPANNTNNDRIVIYNRTTGDIEWEWRFADHYAPRVGGNFSNDWTHTNDVEKIGPDRYLVSPKHFDQVIVVNRTTGAIELQLGEDDDFTTLRQQHNPDYRESEDGTATILVADSENHRIAEYVRDANGWNRTWTLGSADTLNWPRDADRLPTGNTLVTDTKNQRVVEVTPDGDIVWEVYAPWLVYDAVRVPTGEHGGPTMRELNTTGTHNLTGSSGLHTDYSALVRCHAWLQSVEGLTDAGQEFFSDRQGAKRQWRQGWGRPSRFSGGEYQSALDTAISTS